MSPYLIVALIIAAIILTMLVMKWAAKQPIPQVVLDAEAEAWTKLEELVEFVADSKGDQKLIAAAQTRINQRQAQVAAFKAKVAVLSA